MWIWISKSFLIWKYCILKTGSNIFDIWGTCTCKIADVKILISQSTFDWATSFLSELNTSYWEHKDMQCSGLEIAKQVKLVPCLQMLFSALQVVVLLNSIYNF